MCGIVFCKDFRGHDVTTRVLNRYQAQRSRGTEGFGYYIPATNRLSHNPVERKLLSDLASHQANEVLFHHRFPTSTPNVQNACHPFSTNANKALFKHNYVLVHNGYLSNDYDLQEAHEKLGIKYVSEQANGQFNDSEALLYDVALYLEGKQPTLNARGAIAFVVIERDELGNAVKLHYGRNASSPLQLQYKPGKFLLLASEGKGVPVTPQQLHTFDYATRITSSKPLTIQGYEYKTTKITSQYDDDGYHFGQDDYDLAAARYRNNHGDFSYNYYDAAGTHWQANTGANIEDKICHLEGELCPKLAPSANDSAATEALEMAMNRAEWNTEDALDIVELELALARTHKQQLMTKLAAIDEANRSEDVNEYITVAEELDVLQSEIAALDGAADRLSTLLDQEQYNAAQLRLAAGIEATEGELVS